MSTPDPNDTRHDHVDPDALVTEPAPRSNPLLWVVLLLVLLALGWWWYGKQANDTPVPVLPSSTDQPVLDEQTTAAATAPKPATTKQATKKPAAKPRPVAGITRDPSPRADNEPPRYPAQALRSGVEGRVSVRIEVDATGNPTDVKVVERSGERSRDLDRAVLEAVRKWRFNPAMQEGKAVAGAVVLPVEFRSE